MDASALNIDLQPGEVRTETFRYELRAQSDDTSDLGVVTVSIRDPESDTIQVTPNDATVKEIDGQIGFTITRSGDRLNTEETLYVSTTQDHGSTNNNDYVSLLKQPLTFGIGEETKVVPVNILPDSVTEFDEVFGLIVQTDPNDPTSTFFTSTAFTVQDSTTVTGIKKVGNEILFDATAQIDQARPQITGLQDGNFVITWMDLGDKSVKAQVVATDSSMIGGEILVNAATQSSQLFPEIVALPNGGFLIAWEDNSKGVGGASGDFSGTAIKTQIFTADGNKAGNEILVNTATQLSQFNPQIAALSNNGFVITWEDNGQDTGGASGDFSDNAIKAQVFAANGNKTSNEILVNTATQNNQYETKIAALSNDGFVITWLDESQGIGGASGDSDRAVKAQVFAADGSKMGGEILVNTATQNVQEDSQITALSDGGFVITWNDFSQGIGGAGGDSDPAIKAQVFATDGSKIGGEILVNTATHNGQHYAQITALPSGGFVITWMDFSHSIGGANGDFSGVAIKAQIFTADGSKTGNEILVNTATQNDQDFSQITALPDGGFVITWRDFSQGIGGASGDFSDSAIKAQAFSADGSKISDEILVNTSTQNDQINSQIAVLPDGSFAITWEDNGEVVEGGFFSLLGYSIKAQVFKTTGGSVTDIPVGYSIFFVDDSTETVVLEDGNKLVGGLSNDIDGTNIENFGTDDILFISGVELQQSDLTATKGSAILSLDTDNDDISDTVITLAGDYRLESFVVVGASSSGSYITYLGNAVPVGEDDNITTLPEGFATDEDNAFTTANVLANDNDDDDDALSVAALDNTGTLGLVLDNGDGTFNYDPNGAFEHLNLGETATDSFGYTVSDGNGDSDTATVTVTINGIDEEPTLNPITGTTGRDILTGTPADDLISSLGGSIDRMSGGAGADIFVFGDETLNGIRERDIILDYEVGIDSILLEDGASVGSIRPTSSGVAIFFEGDRDAAYVQGDGVLVGNLTFIAEDIILG